MPVTRILIESKTLDTTPTSVTFSSIPQTYTDLVLITSLKLTSGGATNDRLSFNGDTSTAYSNTVFYGTGSIWGSYRSTNATGGVIDDVTSTEFNVNEHHIMDYTNTAMYKTSVGQSAPITSAVQLNVQCRRSTAAITSLTVTTPSDAFATGSTLMLYGILKA